MSDALHPMLLDAKKEYLTRLGEILTPFVQYYMDSIYAAAKEEHGKHQAILCFQEELRRVPGWNNNQIRARTTEIESKYAFLQDLVAAVFVSYVKVLSSIRLSSNRPNVKLKLPRNDDFVHKVYVLSAKKFYENPDMILESTACKASLIYSALEAAVREMLPLGDVLQAYLASAVDSQDHTVNPVLSPMNSEDEDEELDNAVAGGSVSSDGDDDDEDPMEERVVSFPGPQPQQQQPMPMPMPQQQQPMPQQQQQPMMPVMDVAESGSMPHPFPPTGPGEVQTFPYNPERPSLFPGALGDHKQF